MRIVSLFSGAGGFEIGFGASDTFTLCNDVDPAARSVLAHRFPNVPFVEDVRRVSIGDVLSAETLVAGFPCQDVSIVGGQLGMAGSRSALVEHVFRLAGAASPEHLLLENVQSIRFVHGGRVLAYLMHESERLRYAWAYRVLDSRAFGLPQRRRRFYFLASRTMDPGDVLFSQPGGAVPDVPVAFDRPMGFYWTEGRLGNGLTGDAIPPLKAGSAIGIPSPPAVLMPSGRVVVPTIETAERLQGFPAGWTNDSPARQRWRLVGNAVSPPVVAWIANRWRQPEVWDRSLAHRMPDVPIWPTAAWGDGKGDRRAVAVGEAPDGATAARISNDDYDWVDISARALRGFVTRARSSRLRYPAGFLDRLDAQLQRLDEHGPGQRR